MNEIGHNKPPGMIESANGVADDINKWLMDNPVVETELQARVAKVKIDRAKLCLKDLKDERDAQVAPLRASITELDQRYKAPSSTLSGVLEHCELRLGEFIRAETRRREEAAERARQEAEAAKFA